MPQTVRSPRIHRRRCRTTSSQRSGTSAARPSHCDRCERSAGDRGIVCTSSPQPALRMPLSTSLFDFDFMLGTLILPASTPRPPIQLLRCEPRSAIRSHNTGLLSCRQDSRPANLYTRGPGHRIQLDADAHIDRFPEVLLCLRTRGSADTLRPKEAIHVKRQGGGLHARCTP
jgi:hypothetical protein